MNDYDWRINQGRELEDRYATYSWINGVPEWQRGALALKQSNQSVIQEWARTIALLAQQRMPPPCPRVFISHRKNDVTLAVNLAQVASAAGFDYWLDVIDLSTDIVGFLPYITKQLKRQPTKYCAPELRSELQKDCARS